MLSLIMAGFEPVTFGLLMQGFLAEVQIPLHGQYFSCLVQQAALYSLEYSYHFEILPYILLAYINS